MDVTIVNIGPFDWPVSRSYGFFMIPACPISQPYAFIVVKDRTMGYDMGEQQEIRVPLGAADIAKDIVQDLAGQGVFVCASARPSAAELETARATMEKQHHTALQLGDTEWARYHRHEFIPDTSRRAVVALGLEREWAFVPVAKVDCPICGEKIKKYIAKCGHCSAILDPEKALGAGIIGQTQYDELVAIKAKQNKGAGQTKPAPTAPSKPATNPAAKAATAPVKAGKGGIGAPEVPAQAQ